jgi:hypothetical protein
MSCHRQGKILCGIYTQLGHLKRTPPAQVHNIGCLKPSVPDDESQQGIILCPASGKKCNIFKIFCNTIFMRWCHLCY